MKASESVVLPLLTGIAKSRAVRKIKLMASKLFSIHVTETENEYEVDEFQTYVGSGSQVTYLIYAINKNTKRVIYWLVGRRNKENLDRVIQTILASKPAKIFTDKLNIYSAWLNKSIQCKQ